MTDILDLARRCEQAGEPSRELDAAIDVAVFPDHRVDGDHVIDRMGFGKPVPHYTASLDAALSLVPEGCGWISGWGQTRPDEPMGGAQITPSARYNGSFVSGEVIAEAEAKTPAIALCAAALYARAAS